jgi:hypothetical protein
MMSGPASVLRKNAAPHRAQLGRERPHLGDGELSKGAKLRISRIANSTRQTHSARCGHEDKSSEKSLRRTVRRFCNQLTRRCITLY